MFLYVLFLLCLFYYYTGAAAAEGAAPAEGAPSAEGAPPAAPTEGGESIQ